MAIRRWDPFSELMSMRELMDRFFEESFPRAAERLGMSSLAVDVYQTDKDVVVKANIPGVKPEDIDITVTGDVLTIKGEHKEEQKVERENYFYQERRFGSFNRSITLPVPVQTDKAEAKFENGVLELTLPKAEEAKARRIPIRQLPQG